MHQKNLLLQEELKTFKLQRESWANLGQNRKPRAIKDWHKINSECMKHRRINHFKKILLDTFRSMKACHRAEVSLWLDQKRISFSFYPSDLLENTNLKEFPTGRNPNKHCDHTYASQRTKWVEEDMFSDFDYSEIFNSLGEWRIDHIRRLINVMNSFCISHEACHELRMVSKGHLPPIGHLSKEKKKMSEEIPYEKHLKVGIFLCFHIITNSFNLIQLNMDTFVFNRRMQYEDP